MSAPVNVTATETRDFVAEARRAWGDGMPDWVRELAAEATRSTVTAAAARLGRSVGLVSNVIHGKYRGDLAGVEGLVRGALMGAVVDCPVLDKIPRDRCLHEQKMPRAATSPLRTRLYRACRAGCPHSRIRGADDVA